MKIRLLFYTYFPTLLLIVFFVIDGVKKYNYFLKEQEFYLGLLLKGLLLTYMIYFLFKKNKNPLKYITLLFVVFLIGQFYLDRPSLEPFLYFARYSFPLFLFAFFNTYKFSERGKRIFYESFKIILFINSLLIIAGFIFEVKLFETYRGMRFGYSGFIRASAVASYVYIVGVSFYLLIAKRKKDWIFFGITLLASLFIGTKAIYLALILISIIYIILFREKISKLASIVFAFFVSIIIYATYFIINSKGFTTLMKNEGFIAAIVSKRNVLFQQDTLPYIQEHWSLVNYFFGGVDDLSLRSELSLIDIVFFYGFLGGLFYLGLYSYLYFNIKTSGLFKNVIIILFLATILSGNFFFYTLTPLLLIVIRETQKNQ